jgi:hypothetical protein
MKVDYWDSGKSQSKVFNTVSASQCSLDLHNDESVNISEAVVIEPVKLIGKIVKGPI